MTASLTESATLARELLHAALTDLRREASQAGREALFEQLQSALLGRPLPMQADGRSHTGLRRALRRLQTRLRERVDAHLRSIEPDPVQRRALRRQLRATLLSTRPR